MKIKSLKSHVVRVPVTRVAAFAKRKMTHMLSTIVEVETDNGLLGIGEARGDFCSKIINEKFAPIVKNHSVYDFHNLRDLCLAKLPFDYGYPEYALQLNAFAGLEIALWDILGKETGQPLYNLLGGAARDKALFVGYAYTVDPDEGFSDNKIVKIMSDIATASIKETGAKMFEFKVGLHSISCEIQIVKEIRKSLGPEVDIAVDANMGFTIDQAKRFLESTRECNLCNIEEPVAGLGFVSKIKDITGIPVSTHCIDLDALGSHPSIDSVVSDPSLLGGINSLNNFITSVKAINKRFWLRARWELGIGWAAMCHIGINRIEIDRPSQALINWVENDLILGEPWLVRNGGVRPPDKPGLGVELDRKALEKYKIK
jgi:glucarate dehydratase